MSRKDGGKLAKLTLKQKKFADEYIISGKYGSVYCIENRINNKKYIGITTRSLQKRFKEHCKAESVIGKAIRKHKKENFIYYELNASVFEEVLVWIYGLGGKNDESR